MYIIIFVSGEVSFTKRIKLKMEIQISTSVKRTVMMIMVIVIPKEFPIFCPRGGADLKHQELTRLRSVRALRWHVRVCDIYAIDSCEIGEANSHQLKCSNIQMVYLVPINLFLQTPQRQPRRGRIMTPHGLRTPGRRGTTTPSIPSRGKGTETPGTVLEQARARWDFVMIWVIPIPKLLHSFLALIILLMFHFFNTGYMYQYYQKHSHAEKMNLRISITSLEAK